MLQNEPIKLGPNEYACPYCSAVRRDPGIIKRHIRVHTGERPFSCPHCPATFNQKVHCKTHLRKIHGIVEST